MQQDVFLISGNIDFLRNSKGYSKMSLKQNPYETDLDYERQFNEIKIIPKGSFTYDVQTWVGVD